MTPVFRAEALLKHPSSSADLTALQRFVLYVRRVAQKDAPWVTVLVLLNLIFFGDALFTDKTFFVRDVSFFHYPLKRLVTEAFTNGQWPLWNPYVQLGQPLLANPNAMALYPTQILFQILPFQIAFDLHFVLHCLLAGIAAFHLGRTLGLSRHAAFLSAGIYNFSGITLSFVNLFNILPVVAFLPLLALVLIKTLRSYSLLKAACASLLFGIFFLLLEPLSSLAVALFLIPLLAGIVFFSPPPRCSFVKATSLVLVIVVSGLLLASAQILPTLELMQHSGRRGGMEFDVVSFWSFHPICFLQVIFPRLFGEYFRLAEPPPWGNLFFDNREPYLLSGYLGFFPLLLGLWGGIFSKKRWIVNLLLGVSVLGILLALGKYSPYYSWLFQYCPIFRYGRYPVKFLFLVNFCLALLAGFGLDRIEELRDESCFKSKGNNRGTLLFLFSVVALFLFSIGLSSERVLSKMNVGVVEASHLSFHYQGQTLNISRSIIAGSLRNVQIHLGAFLIFLLLIRWKKIRLNIVRGAVLSLILLDLFINNFWINPLIQADLYEPAPVALFINSKMQKEGPSRIYALEQGKVDKSSAILGQTDSVAWVALYRKLTLFQFLAAKDRIQYSVFDPIDRLETFPSQKVRQDLALAQTLDDKLKILAGLNVGFILSAREVSSSLLSLEALFQVNSNQPLRIYRLTNRLPRAYLIDSDEPELEESADQTNYREPLVPPARKNHGGTYVPDDQKVLGSDVKISNYSANLIEIEARAEKKCFLVLLDSYYPGWRASVDNHEAAISCFQGAFRGVELPSGKHKVIFSYTPKTFGYGLYISLFTGIAWIASFLVSHLLAK